MADTASAPDTAAIATLPSIALSLRRGDAAACNSAAAQLRDLVTKAPADTATEVCAAVAAHGDVVDASFVQALGRADMDGGTQHALVLAMLALYMQVHEECNEPSSPMMQASPIFIPILTSIIAREDPVSTSR